MKKLLLSAIAIAAFSAAATAQENGGLKAGIHIGAPMGDAADVYSLNFGTDVTYTFNVAEKLAVGATTGYSYFSGKEVSYSDGMFSLSYKINSAFIPVAATGQYSITDNIFAGADLGYAFSVGDDIEGGDSGGFYYQPKAGYQHEFFEVYAAYKGISIDGGTVSSLNLGFNYKF
jgi:hypothetical protein